MQWLVLCYSLLLDHCYYTIGYRTASYILLHNAITLHAATMLKGWTEKLVSRGQTANFFTGRYRLQYKRPHFAYTASDNAL